MSFDLCFPIESVTSKGTICATTSRLLSCSWWKIVFIWIYQPQLATWVSCSISCAICCDTKLFLSNFGLMVELFTWSSSVLFVSQEKKKRKSVLLDNCWVLTYIFQLSSSSVTTKGTTYATTPRLLSCSWWKIVPTWIYHHPSTNHNSSHGWVVAQVVPFVVTPDFFFPILDSWLSCSPDRVVCYLFLKEKKKKKKNCLTW